MNFSDTESQPEKNGHLNPSFVPEVPSESYKPAFQYPQNRQLTFIHGEKSALEIRGDDSEKNGEDKGVIVALRKLPRKKLLLLVAACTNNFISLACASLHAPFYPRAVRLYEN